MSYLLRCEKKLEFWLYIRWRIGDEIRAVYRRLRNQKIEVQGRRVVYKGVTLREDVSQAWDWCYCSSGHCECLGEIQDGQRTRVLASRETVSPARTVLEKAFVEGSRSGRIPD